MPRGVYKRTEESLRGIRAFSRTKVGKKRPPFSKEWKVKIGDAFRGKELSLEHRQKISQTLSGKQPKNSLGWIGESHPRWKGGKPGCKDCGKILSTRTTKICRDCFRKDPVTPVNQRIRKSTEYRLWRKAVFERNKYACVWCLEVGGRLNADHIKPFAYYPELRFAIDNGRTLCNSCHLKTDTYGRKALNYKTN